MPPRVIIVDGVAGAGKSTTTGFIVRQLRWSGIDAVQVGESGDLTARVLPRPPREGIPARHLDPPWPTPIPLGTPDEWLIHLLPKWEAFVASCTNDSKVHVFDGHLFHAALDEMHFIDADPTVADRFATELLQILAPLNPVFIHLYSDDLPSTMPPVFRSRGSAWTRHQVDWKVSGPHGRRLGYSGIYGLEKLFADFVAIARAVTNKLNVPVLSLNVNNGVWSDRHCEIVEFLQQTGHPITHRHSIQDAVPPIDGSQKSVALRWHPEAQDFLRWRNVTTLEGNLISDANYAMRSLVGLENLMSVGGQVDIGRSPNLQDLRSLNNLKTIGGGLHLYQCPALVSLGGLGGIETLAGSLHIAANESLESLVSFSRLSKVSRIVLYANRVLQSLQGLERIRIVQGDVLLTDLDALSSLVGLNGLERVEAGVTISYNTDLQSLTGLEQLTTIEGPLRIVHNPRLTSFEGLDGLASVGDVYIVENGSLSNAEVDRFAARLRASGHVGRFTAIANGPAYDSSVQGDWY